jgi:hypothetical protein
VCAFFLFKDRKGFAIESILGASSAQNNEAKGKINTNLWL